MTIQALLIVWYSTNVISTEVEYRSLKRSMKCFGGIGIDGAQAHKEPRSSEFCLDHCRPIGKRNVCPSGLLSASLAYELGNCSRNLWW